MEPQSPMIIGGDGSEERGRTPHHEEASRKTLPVRVVARARPLSSAELVQSNRSCLAFDAGGKALVLGKDRAFSFDAVYPPSASQESIYNEWVEPLVHGCFSGYNATVLAYGQTGAGIIQAVYQTVWTYLFEEPGLSPAPKLIDLNRNPSVSS